MHCQAHHLFPQQVDEEGDAGAGGDATIVDAL